MEFNYPRFGIVTPSFNQGAFIRETIESVLEQQYPNLDYCVIDAGSTDNTIEVLRSYGSRISWISERDDGQAAAINKGLRRTTGDIVAFINSDDLYLPGTLSFVARYFHDHPDAMWLTGDYAIIDADGREMQSLVASYKRLLRRGSTFQRLAIANFIVQPSTFWRRGLLDENGWFDESLRYCFDYDFWMRAMQRHPLHAPDRPLSLFRIHRASKGGSEYSRQFAEEHAVLKRHTDSRTLLFLHRVHAAAIVQAYRLMKR